MEGKDKKPKPGEIAIYRRPWAAGIVPLTEEFWSLAMDGTISDFSVSLFAAPSENQWAVLPDRTH